MASGETHQPSSKPMNDKHRKIIRSLRVELARDMEPRQVIHHMADVLTEIDEEEIKAQATRWRQCETLLYIIPKRGEKAFHSFVKALKEVEQPFLANLLVEAESSTGLERRHQTVPEEIILRGRPARQAFSKAILEGKMQVRRVPIMIVGQDRSGKTSLKKSLKGELFDPQEKSTVMMEVDPSYCELKTEVWKIVGGNPARASTDSGDSCQDLFEMIDEDEDKGEIYSILWDFGGQAVYYTTNPLFLTEHAIYFLVYNLNRNPDDKATPLVKQGMFKVFEDRFSDRTNMAYLDFWMSSISCFAVKGEECQKSSVSQKVPVKLPPVFFICTHADKPYSSKDSPKELAREIHGNLLKKASGEHLIEDVFVVDNTKSGTTDECQEVLRLRTEVFEVAKELPHLKKVVPKKWFKFEKNLLVLCGRGYKWISIGTAREVAHNWCGIIQEDEFATLVNLLHDQRIIIHFSDTPELDEMVVLNLQWLIDIFKKVITIVPHASKDTKFKELCHKLEITGILEEELLNHVWGDIEEKTRVSLIALMERFSLLCPWPSSSHPGKVGEYLVPYMLKSDPTEEVVKQIESVKMPSLFLKFQSGQMPSSFFHRLVVQFFQCCTENWQSPRQPELFLNCAKFYIHDGYSVILLSHPSFVEVVVYRDGTKGVDVAISRAVCCQLQLLLEGMRQDFFWLKNKQFEMSVLCPVCCQRGARIVCNSHDTKGWKKEECLHFLSVSELHSPLEPITCAKSAHAGNTVQTKMFAHWFEFFDDENATNEKEGQRLLIHGKDEEETVVLPSEVLRVLLSPSCDAREVVARLQESLFLDQASLELPDPSTKKLIRDLSLKAKAVKRLDVLQTLREIAPPGTTGPLLPESCDVGNIPSRQMRDLTITLSGGDEWMLFAERLGLTSAEIRYFDKRVVNPCDAALTYAVTQGNVRNVGDLYDILVDCGFPVMADLL